MKINIAVVIILLLLMPLASLGQTQKTAAPLDNSEASAHEAVMHFLQGIKIVALPEGKRLLAETQWIVGDADRGQHFYSRPEYKNVMSIFATLFDTDTPGVKGFKELFDMSAVTNAGTIKNIKFLVIAYKNRGTGIWKVLGSLGNSDDEAAIDVDSQIDFFKSHLADTRYVSARDNYASYGHWLLLGGRISEAHAALISATTASIQETVTGRSDSDPILDLQIKMLLDVIDSITSAPN